MRSFLSVTLLFGAVSALPLLSGCTTEAACFANCHGIDGDAKGGNAGSDSTGVAGTLNLGFGGDSDNPSSGGGSLNVGGGKLEDAGTSCDKVDLQTDVNNCGSCGNVCIFTGADAMCVKGECVMSECHEDRYDIDKDSSNGCEYTCAPDPDPTEKCDYLDNDCDGVKDDGFDLTTDAQNCGVCGHACSLLHAGSECKSSADGPTCVVTTCEDGWHDVDKVDGNGCEYQCAKTGPGGVACAAGDVSCGAELCDALDNDCNGVINDGNEANGGPGGGAPCNDFCAGGVCKGECTAGVSTCVGHDLVCVPGKGPSLEKCDGKDNDCDGVNDNGFDLSKDANNCGACGVSCVNTVPNAIGTCKSPGAGQPVACDVLTCKPGFRDLKADVAGCEYQCPTFPTRAETCNGVDDDCDGVVDNLTVAQVNAQKPAVVSFCNNGRPVAGTPCAATSVSCDGTNGWKCNYVGSGIEIDAKTKKVRISEALCDDADGNCDGQVDEAFLDKGKDCTLGTGVCSRSGKYACTSDHTSTMCPVTAVATDAVDELCNGLDDDCDGAVDERTPVAGSKCFNGGSHDCLGYVEPMVKVNNSLWVYSYEASHPDASAADPGVYDVRSCSKLGVMPWTSISQASADATCAALPTSVANTKMHLCTDTEWQTACLAGGSANTTTWSFSTFPTTYDDKVCNDAASGLDSPWVTGFNNGQSQRCRTSTQIFDMSGNVAELTSPCFTVLGKQYCRIRGGSYLSQGPATSCNFTFVINGPSFLNFDIGFRCCSSVAP